MASSGIWENVMLSKTPTLDGVHGLLFFTILVFVGIVFVKCWHVCQYVMLADGIANFLMLFVTDVIVTNCFKPLDVIGRCYLPCGCDMADDFCHCARWNSHIFVVVVADEKPYFEIIDDVVIVADGKATMWMADVIAIVVDGITKLPTSWCYNQCIRWNSHMCDSWCYC